ncbi:hypothetical protein VTK26DRAFT_5192 [Humicola hyalothermophila]
MRDNILASLLLASASLASASPLLECLQTHSQSRSAPASCGDRDALTSCFSRLPELTTPSETTLAQDLEQCFRSAGCTPTEAQIQSLWLLQRCPASNPPQKDLRRGRRNPASSPDDDSSAFSDLAMAAKAPVLAVRDGLTAFAHPAAMTAAAMEPRQNAPAPTTATTRPSPSPCFTDVVSTTDFCEKNVCTPRAVTKAVCREGLICRVDNSNTQTCMYKESALGTAGIVIAVVFASAVAISVVSICVLCCRERREHRRIQRAAEAAKIAKEAAVASKRPGVSVTGTGAASEGQPLMYQAPAAGDVGAGGPDGQPYVQPYQSSQQQQQQQQQQPGGGYGGGGPNPFAEAGDGHPLR